MYKFPTRRVFSLGVFLLTASGSLDAQTQKNDATKEAARPNSTNGINADLAPSAEPAPAIAPSDKARVTGVRFLSSPAYTRVMLDLSQEAKYEIRQLKEDTAKGVPPRIYIDIAGARLALTAKEALPVEDGLLKQIRIGQYSADVVRVVLDMQSLRGYNAFILPDPYRLVVDLQGAQPAKTPAQAKSKELPVKQPAAKRGAASKEDKKPAPSAAAPSGIRKIVLDPGHGGKDPGAIGVGGSAEKDIVLAIAKKLAAKLQKELGVKVVLTRKNDRFVALENRTAIANAEDADLFISLHMNASVNGEAHGIETYYLDNTSDEAALRLAARENGTSRKNVSDLQFILSDMTQNMKLEDSISLAHRLQKSAVSGMAKPLGEVKDLGVKKALFYVLVGARMPSVLVEMGFVTHRKEGRVMSQANAQDVMVEALMRGIQDYAQAIMIARTL